MFSPTNFDVPRRVLLLGAMAIAFCSGCGDGASMAPVTGVVTMDGAPVEGVVVVFTPQAKEEGSVYAATKPSSSFTDAEGAYSLSTKKENDGAAVGKHVVTVFAADRNTPPPGSLPPGHTVEVKSGNNTIDLELEPLPGR